MNTLTGGLLTHVMLNACEASQRPPLNVKSARCLQEVPLWIHLLQDMIELRRQHTRPLCTFAVYSRCARRALRAVHVIAVERVVSPYTFISDKAPLAPLRSVRMTGKGGIVVFFYVCVAQHTIALE